VQGYLFWLILFILYTVDAVAVAAVTTLVLYCYADDIELFKNTQQLTTVPLRHASVTLLLGCLLMTDSHLT